MSRRVPIQRRIALGVRAPLRPMSRDYVSPNARGGFDGLGADAPLTTVSIKNLGELQKNLESTWNPTGFYTRQQMWDLLNQFYKIYLAVSKVADNYLADAWTIGKDSARVIQQRMSQDWHNFSDRFQSALAAANASGGAIEYLDAPGFKGQAVHFVGQMNTDLQSLATLAAANSIVWSTLPGAREYLSFCVGAANVIKTIVGVSIDVVKAAANAVMKIPDTIGTIITVAKWGAILFGGLWLYREFGPNAHRAT